MIKIRRNISRKFTRQEKVSIIYLTGPVYSFDTLWPHLQYHSIKQLSFQLQEELLEGFQLLLPDGELTRVMVH